MHQGHPGISLKASNNCCSRKLLDLAALLSTPVPGSPEGQGLTPTPWHFFVWLEAVRRKVHISSSGAQRGLGNRDAPLKVSIWSTAAVLIVVPTSQSCKIVGSFPQSGTLLYLSSFQIILPQNAGRRSCYPRPSSLLSHPVSCPHPTPFLSIRFLCLTGCSKLSLFLVRLVKILAQLAAVCQLLFKG